VAPPTPSFVPWLALPATGAFPQAPVPSPTSPVPVPAGTASCAAGQVEALVFSRGGGAGGHTDTPVILRNKSSAPCYVDGYPDITVLDRAGRVLAAATGALNRGTFFDGAPAVPVLLPPGGPPLPSPGQELSRGQAFVNIEWFDCRRTTAATMSIDMPSAGGRLTIPYAVDAPWSALCDGNPATSPGLTRGPFSPAGYTWPPGPVYLAVDIGISAPSSVKAGSALIYFVSVTNSSPTDYRLDPCPDYVEILGAKNAVANYQLNCGPVGSIAAGTKVKFQMRLDLPVGMPTGPTQLDWSLADGRLSLPFARAPVTVV